MKKVSFLSFIFLFNLINAQVGIGTKTPQKTLHVNGNLQITSELNVGGDSLTEGSSGEYGAYLISNGANTAPTWKNLASLGIQKLVNVSLTTTASSTYNSATIIKYDSTPYIDSNYISYDSTAGSFTILVDGYYNISGYTNINMYGGGGTISYNVYSGSTDLFFKNTNFSTSVSSSGISVGGATYLSANSVITQTIRFTRSFSINNGSFSITYLGNGN